MMITPKQTNIAYRCPNCGQGVKSVVGIFSLTGDRMRLKCTCGESYLNIDRANDGKRTITVPCAMCGNEHRFTISEDTLFKKEIFSYPCTYTGIDCCFIGLEEKVEEALDQNEKDVIDLYRSMGIEDPAAMLPQKQEEADEEDDEITYDGDILDTIIYVLRDLADTDSIKCNCDTPELDYTRCNGYVKVYCKSCEASVDIPSRGRADAEKILECHELKLK